MAASAQANSESLEKIRSTIAPKQRFHDTGLLTRDDFDGGPVSLDEIEKGLYLGRYTVQIDLI